MRLAEQWQRLEQQLPARWSEARLSLKLGESDRSRALALLGPANPGRRGDQIRFVSARGGAGAGPVQVRRLLQGLDADGIAGTLELVASTETASALAPEPARLAPAWERALGTLPSDWSDVLAEVELVSSDYLDRGALLLAPVNPARHGNRVAFRFRCARRFGYGVSPRMAGRSLERLDEEGIRGEVRILRALSDTRPVATQGPVWYVDGRAV